MLNIVFIIYITLYNLEKRPLKRCQKRNQKNFKKLEKRC